MSKTSFIKRLSSIGVASLADLALVVPSSYQDMRLICSSLCQLPNESHALVKASLIRPLNDNGFVNGSPTARGKIVMEDGTEVSFTLFGGFQELTTQWNPLVGMPLYFYGQVKQINEQWYISRIEVVDNLYAGRMRPIYTGKPKVVNADTLREYVINNLPDAIQQAVIKLRKSIIGDELIKEVINPIDLPRIIRDIHLPSTPEQAESAIKILDHLAALLAKRKLQEHFLPMIAPSITSNNQWERLLSRLPFDLTNDQLRAIEGIIGAISKTNALRGVLLGDVGSGKTAVYAVLSAWSVWCGHRVAIMLPGTTLANQVYEEILSYFPKINCALVTGSEDNSNLDLKSCQLLIGTTALLHREVGDFSLVVVDEEHRYSREQREQLQNGNAHLLSVTATPIPRSAALIKLGALQQWKINADIPNKKIVSMLAIGSDAYSTLEQKVHNCLSKGHQAIVVYTIKEDGKNEKLISAESAFEFWNNRYPGRVVLAHGDNDKEAAINAMKRGEVDLLISTTVIEVGVTIPKVMMLAVVNPDRMGLVQLHQLRGRIARKGGHGLFMLVLPESKYADKTIDRMRHIVFTQDGYELALIDQQQRGSGDLSVQSSQQTGDDSSFLINRPINMAVLEQICEKKPIKRMAA